MTRFLLRLSSSCYPPFSAFPPVFFGSNLPKSHFPSFSRAFARLFVLACPGFPRFLDNVLSARTQIRFVSLVLPIPHEVGAYFHCKLTPWTFLMTLWEKVTTAACRLSLLPRRAQTRPVVLSAILSLPYVGKLLLCLIEAAVAMAMSPLSSYGWVGRWVGTCWAWPSRNKWLVRC